MKHGKQIPVVEIEKGHCRTGWKKDEKGYALFVLRAENYKEPGTIIKEEEKMEPVICFRLWGSEQARLMGMSFMFAAEQMRWAEEEAAKEDTGLPQYDGLTGRMEEL